MLTKRIIPCLDIRNGRTVKGVNFVDIKDAGDPVALAVKYAASGADELVFLDITATIEARATLLSLVNDIASSINIPFTVGGGITSLADVEVLLKNGADKISINSFAVCNPDIIKEMSTAFGSQCVVVAIDTKKEINENWQVYLNGGRLNTGLDCSDWARQAVDLGAGEILLTSMNNDGTKEGFALDITKKLAEQLPVPVIASGGAGRLEHFRDVFQLAAADAALAAGIFHFGEMLIPDLKNYLLEQGIPVRPNQQ
ncbi:MAG: hisF [Ferruginibacter sp.]|nr:hisF [Ferruginibacter sp.]